MRLLTFSVALLSSTSLLFAQPEKELEKANEMYKNFSYVDAIKIYERIAQKRLCESGDAREFGQRLLLQMQNIKRHFLGTNNFFKKVNTR